MLTLHGWRELKASRFIEHVKHFAGPRHIHSVQQEIARLQDERQKMPFTWQKDSLAWTVVVFRSLRKLWIQMFSLGDVGAHVILHSRPLAVGSAGGGLVSMVLYLLQEAAGFGCVRIGR